MNFEMGAYVRLHCAIILQAIADIDIQQKDRFIRLQHSKKSRQSMPYKLMTLMTNEATEWIESPATHRHSFEWICDVTGLDARKIRELSRTRHGRKMLLRSAPRSAAIKGLNAERSKDILGDNEQRTAA